MIYVALVGLPVLILVFGILLLVVGSPDSYEGDNPIPGKPWYWSLPMSVALVVLCTSFVIHLMEVL